MTTLQSVIDRINAEAGPQLLAAGLNPTDFVASIPDGANGIAFTQNAAFTNKINVATLNNSLAADQLGLIAGTQAPASATFIGEDRSKVRVDSLFTQLIDLRDSLTANSTSGIALAGSDLEKSVSSLVETRGLMGGYAKRVDEAKVRETDRATIDEATRSELQDVDYTFAATRFTLLQTQLEAGLRVTALAGSRTLLDFLA